MRKHGLGADNVVDAEWGLLETWTAELRHRGFLDWAARVQAVAGERGHSASRADHRGRAPSLRSRSAAAGGLVLTEEAGINVYTRSCTHTCPTVGLYTQQV